MIILKRMYTVVLPTAILMLPCAIDAKPFELYQLSLKRKKEIFKDASYNFPDLIQQRTGLICISESKTNKAFHQKTYQYFLTKQLSLDQPEQQIGYQMANYTGSYDLEEEHDQDIQYEIRDSKICLVYKPTSMALPIANLISNFVQKKISSTARSIESQKSGDVSPKGVQELIFKSLKELDLPNTEELATLKALQFGENAKLEITPTLDNLNRCITVIEKSNQKKHLDVCIITLDTELWNYMNDKRAFNALL